MTKPLFEDFNDVSAKQWKQQIQFDLKGLDYNDTLVWKSKEDILVKPFYHVDDFQEPYFKPNTKATAWKICEEIYVSNAQKGNVAALNALNKGTESLSFIIPNDDISLKELLKGIDLKSIPVFLNLEFLSSKYAKNQLNQFEEVSQIRVKNDIIGNLAKHGNFYFNLSEDFKQFEEISKHNQSISIDTTLYQNAGATIVQQLVYGLAHANEYLNFLNTGLFRSKAVDRNKLKVIFNVSVGSNYFFEIAKLRAFRILWQHLATEYDCNENCHIIAAPTKRNKTLYDYNTNMLRTTTESMSAILGGADSIINLAYDTIYHKNNEFGSRIARNQLLILKHESYFDKVNNPTDGAYYIESLTNQLAEKALNIFKDIEENGGFLKQLKSGTIQRKIKESAAKEQADFDNGNEVLVGTNKHPNSKDRMKDELELYPFIKTLPRKTLIEPIIEKRLAETIEKERLKNE